MRWVGTLLVLIVATAAFAADPCATLPEAARAYLNTNPGWAVITPADLAADDRALWARQHRRDCPGLALADLDGSGRPFAALGLISRRPDEISERIILVRQAPGGLEVRVLVPDERTSAPVVLFHLPPGKAKQWDSDREIVIAHDSVGVAWLAASSRQYYWDNSSGARGTFVCAQTTD
jgi:hypothetical protein